MILFAMALEKDSIVRLLVQSGDVDLNLYGMMSVKKTKIIPQITRENFSIIRGEEDGERFSSEEGDVDSDGLSSGEGDGSGMRLKEMGLRVVREDLFIDVCPLHYATFMGHLSIVILLLQAGAEVNSVCDTAGDQATCLHIAVESFREDLCEVLVKYGGDCGIRNSEGESAVEMAERLGFVRIAKVLKSVER